MVKTTILIVSLTLTGCATQVPKVETKEVMVPSLFCPAPPENSRPSLPIDTISSQDDIGTVAMKYKASLRALIDYSERQEDIIQMYKILSETSKQIERPKVVEIREVPAR